MTTLSRAAVEGTLAMPRMRPLGDPTLSFGGEWRFSLPQVDFRTDFPALYAAVLETFCANRWLKADKPAARRTPETQASSLASSAAAICAPSQAAPIAPPSPVRPIAAAIHSTPRERKIGAACALAGAAVLSWIVLAHLPPSFTAQHAARTSPAAGGSTEGFIKPATKPASALPLVLQPELSNPSEEHVPLPRHPAEPAVRPETVVRRPPLPATLAPIAHGYADQAAEHAAGQSAADASNPQQETSQAATPAKL